jgi:nicotinamidase-related amidase
MKKGLLVIDMLNDFLTESGKLYIGDTAKTLIPHVVKRINEYNENDIPIIFAYDRHKLNDREFNRFPAHCVENTKGAEHIEELIGMTGSNIYFVIKTKFDAFYDTVLSNVLIELCDLRPGNSVIEVCGVCTHICVSDTVGSLANRGYPTVVNRNCVGDFDQSMHHFALRRMENIYGTEII